MLKSDIREISGRRFRVTEVGTEEGLRLFFKLTKLIGPSMAELLKQWQGGTLKPVHAMPALSEFIAQLQWNDLSEFVNVFAKATVELVQGVDEKTGEPFERQVPLDKTIKTTAFAGDYMTLMKWLGFCLEHNFASFFAGMGVTKLPDSAETE